MRNLVLLIICAALFSCEKADNLRPEITRSDINGVTSSAYINKGDELRFNATIDDNESLNRLVVTVQKGYFAEDDVVITDRDLVYSNNFSLSGTREEVSGTINIGDNVASGTYHLLFEATDKEGNKAIVKRVNFTYQDTPENRPGFVYDNVIPEVSNSVITIARGNAITFDGYVISAIDLKAVNYKILENDALELSLSKELSGESDLRFEFEDFTNSSGEVIPLIVPSTTPKGTYVLLVQAEDSNGNVAVTQFILEVTF